MAAATLEQEMGRRSVAAAIRPIKDRTIASSSSAEKPITQERVAEACDTLVRERHPASPPVWPEGSEIPAGSDPDRTRGTEILPEPPLPRRKTASNAEWHSALQTKSRDEKWDQRDRLSQFPVEECGG